MIMELEDKDERTFEDFLAFLQLHPELKTWEIGPEPILSLPGLQIYPDRRKIYHGQQEIELNTKEFALLCLLVTNKGRVLTYGQMYGTGSYYLRRVHPERVEKDICTYCGQRPGFDYEVVKRRQ